MDLTPPPDHFAFMETFAVESAYFPKVRGLYVTYLRQSERPHSRLDVGSQRREIDVLLDKRHCRLVRTFTEREPLKAGQRPLLDEAISICRKEGATLVFGKLNRMRGAKRWLDQLFDDWIKFRSADLPHLNLVSYQELRSREQRRREEVGAAIKKSIAEKRNKGLIEDTLSRNIDGLKKGASASLKARQGRALSRDRITLSFIREVQRQRVTSLSGIAMSLNDMGHAAPRGGKWSPAQVRTVLLKFK